VVGASETVIVLVGKTAAGKSTVASLLEERWRFDWIKTRDVILGLSNDLDKGTSLQVLGKRFMSPTGALQFAEAVKERLREGFPAVIDSIRPESHYAALVQTLKRHICIVAVIASPDRRCQRFQRRSGESELEWQTRESALVESEVPHLIERAEYAVVNQSDDLSALEADVDRMVGFIMQGDLYRTLK